MRLLRPVPATLLTMFFPAVVSFFGLLDENSPTYVSSECGFFGLSGPSVGHLGVLYYAWGFCIAALLYQAARFLRQRPPEPRASRYEQPGWRQEPPAGPS